MSNARHALEHSARTARLSAADAQAVERALRADPDAHPSAPQSCTAVFFVQAGPTAAGLAKSRLCALESSALPGRLTLELTRVLDDGALTRREVIAYDTLRAAMRPNVLRLLLPGAPDLPVACLGMRFVRRTYCLGEVQLHLDRGVDFVRVKPEVVEEEGALRLGEAAWREEGAAATLEGPAAKAPAWLRAILSQHPGWDAFEEGRAHLASKLAPRPGTAALEPFESWFR